VGVCVGGRGREGYTNDHISQDVIAASKVVQPEKNRTCKRKTLQESSEPTSEYEKARLSNILKNQTVMAGLGLGSETVLASLGLPDNPAKNKATTKRPLKKKGAIAQRKSTRQTINVNYKETQEEEVDEDSDDNNDDADEEEEEEDENNDDDDDDYDDENNDDDDDDNDNDDDADDDDNELLPKTNEIFVFVGSDLKTWYGIVEKVKVNSRKITSVVVQWLESGSDGTWKLLDEPLCPFKLPHYSHIVTLQGFKWNKQDNTVKGRMSKTQKGAVETIALKFHGKWEGKKK
jgi:hypothetical protein